MSRYAISKIEASNRDIFITWLDPGGPCDGDVTVIDIRAALAASDLLEACNAALASLMHPEFGQRETLKLLRDAIAKAEGK